MWNVTQIFYDVISGLENLKLPAKHRTYWLTIQGYQYVAMEDLILEHELRIAKLKLYNSFECSCLNCKGRIQKSISTVMHHLRTMPRNWFLYHSIVGEDPMQGFPTNGLWIPTSKHLSNMDKRSNNDDVGV